MHMLMSYWHKCFQHLTSVKAIITKRGSEKVNIFSVFKNTTSRTKRPTLSNKFISQIINLLSVFMHNGICSYKIVHWYTYLAFMRNTFLFTDFSSFCACLMLEGWGEGYERCLNNCFNIAQGAHTVINASSNGANIHTMEACSSLHPSTVSVISSKSLSEETKEKSDCVKASR